MAVAPSLSLVNATLTSIALRSIKDFDIYTTYSSITIGLGTSPSQVQNPRVLTAGLSTSGMVETTFTGLIPGTQYYAWAKARTNNGIDSPWSARLAVKTDPAPVARDMVITRITDIGVYGNVQRGSSLDTAYQIGWGSGSAVEKTTAVAADNTWQIVGFAPNSTWSLWTRTQQQGVWGPWGDREIISTFGPPEARDAPTVTNIKQTKFDVSTSSPIPGEAPVAHYEWNWFPWTTGTPPAGTSFNSTTDYRLATGPYPGGTDLGIRVRAVSAYGTSPWSGITRVTLVAGAWVKQGTVWKRAMPYVNVKGVWKPATPWTKTGGVWRDPTL